MGFSHGRNTVVLFNQYDLSSYFSQADVSHEVDLPETTTFGNTSRRYEAIGLKGGTASLSGYWDGSVDAVDPILQGALGTSAAGVMTIGPAGLTLGDRVRLLSARETSYSTSSPIDGVVGVSAEMQADGGVEAGSSLHTLGAETATADGSALDQTASSSNGALGHLHVTAMAGTVSPTATIKIQDSLDDITWSDLITFTAATAATSERVAVTGAVDRYVRATWAITGTSPSFTFAVVFARR